MTAAVPNEYQRRAEQVGLHYVSDQSDGYTRRRCGQGFSYQDHHRKTIRDNAIRNWIESLAIPPAWTEVWISPNPHAHLLATGRDAEARKQYIYHPEWETASSNNNFARLYAFGKKLPTIRDRVEADLRRQGLVRERILALVVHLLDETLIRIGNDQYAEANQSYGLTTLQQQHAELSSNKVRFGFTGKSGKWVEAEVQDPRIAKLISRCGELPGEDLFQYIEQDSKVVSLESADVNDYLQRTTLQAFTAKDFRTWGGSVTAAEYIAKHHGDYEKTDSLLVASVKASAERLNNTPAVCRRHYIHPTIFSAAESGDIQRLWPRCRSGKLSRPERLLLKLLR